MSNAIETIVKELLRFIEQSIVQLSKQLKSSIINN